MQNSCLSYVSSVQKYKISGANANDKIGSSLSNVGDFDGDGYDDFIIGAPEADPNLKTDAGLAYIIFGSSISSNLDLSSLSLKQGFSISGANPGDQLGFSVRGISDINNDGFADIAIGAPFASPSTGAKAGITYIIFGFPNFTNIDLANYTGDRIFQISGESENDYYGYSVSSAGDFNNDNIPDLVVSSPGAESRSVNPFDGTGKIYVIFGQYLNSNIDLSSLSLEKGFKVYGELLSFFGVSVSNAGDMNKDGFDDIIIGASSFDKSNNIIDTGKAYIIFGSNSSVNIDASQLQGSQGISIGFSFSNFKLGQSVSKAGDLNGDGFSDVIIGAPYREGSGFYCVVFGNTTLPNIISSSSSSQNYVCVTGNSYAQTGYSVSGGYDFNNDGFDDLLIGALFDDGCVTDAGRSYVIYGTGTKNLPGLYGLQSPSGFYLGGESLYDTSGYSVSFAGDINNDGYADILIGSNGASPNSKTHAGAVYLIFGSASLTYSPTMAPSSLSPTLVPTLKPFYNYPLSLSEDILLAEYATNLISRSLSNSTVLVSYSKSGNMPYGHIFNSGLSENREEIQLSSGFPANVYSYGWKVKAASITNLTNGNFVFSWQNSGSGASKNAYILYKIFDKNGNALTSDSLANNGKTNFDSFNPSLVGTNNGGFIVVWQGYGLSSSTSQFDISSRAFDKSGSLISNSATFSVSNSIKIQSNPSAIRLSNGFYVLTWYDQNYLNIYAKIYDSNFNTIKSDYRVNTYSNNFEYTYPLAVALSDRFLITWESYKQDGDDYGIFGQLYYNNGNKIGAEFQVNSYTKGFQGNHDAAQLNKNTFIVVWKTTISQPISHDELRGQLFLNDNTKVGNEFRINSYNSGSRDYVSVAALGIDNFIVSWSGVGLDKSFSETSGVFIKFLNTDSIKNGAYNPDVTNQPTISPSTLNQLSTNVPTKLPTISPSNSLSTEQTSNPSKFPTLSPNNKPTFMPTRKVSIVDGGEYSGDSSDESFIISSSENVRISGGGGTSTFVVMPSVNMTITVTDFNITSDKINLEAFAIQNFEQLNITAGSIIITLERSQVIKLLELSPENITFQNFIFASASGYETDTKVDNSSPLSLGAIAGMVIGGVSLIGFSYGCLAYANHLWPFAINKVAVDVVDSALNHQEVVQIAGNIVV